MGSSINSSELKEKAHPSVNNRSVLIANLLGQYIIIVIPIGQTHSFGMQDEIFKRRYLHLSRKKMVLKKLITQSV